MRQRDVFLFWLPLFSSWLLMMAEGPLISAVINRLPQAVVHLAALGIVFSLAVAIESPIINLLATSTALVRDAASYRQVRRFTLHWALGLTLVAAALAFTPLFDLVVGGWLRVPDEIAFHVLPGMRVMVPWSAAIAWRRFLQGVLIAGKRTGAIAWGTGLRLATSAGTAVGLALATELPGVLVGAYSLVIGVAAEALFATWAARPVIARLANRSQRAELTYERLFRFHLPLAMTSVLTLLTQPLVAACLARLDRPVETLAAWPLIFQFMLLMRAIAFALPEVVIALGSDPDNARPLRRFTATLTAVSFGSMSLFALSPLAGLYLSRLQSAPAGVSELVRLGFVLLIPLPPLATLVSWHRGTLIGQGRTLIVNEAMIVRLAATGLVLASGLIFGWRGVVTAAGALVLSVAVELIYLTARSYRGRVSPPGSHPSSRASSRSQGSRREKAASSLSSGSPAPRIITNGSTSTCAGSVDNFQ
jgi:hypothetical protein